MFRSWSAFLDPAAVFLPDPPAGSGALDQALGEDLPDALDLAGLDARFFRVICWQMSAGDGLQGFAFSQRHLARCCRAEGGSFSAANVNFR